MKKTLVSALIIGVFIFYSLRYRQSSSATPIADVPRTATAPSTASSPPASTSSGDSTAAPSATDTPSTRYKDGSYTGSVADAQWGYIQVKAIVKNGKLTDVQYLQYPNERDRSVEINQYADPQLTSEAIQAQSAQVDAITGATDTSFAFMQSLGDALAHAQA